MRLRLAKQTLARWRCEGRGPAFLRLGKRVLYGEADVEAWLSAKRFHSTSENQLISSPTVRIGRRLVSPQSVRNVVTNLEQEAAK